MSESPDSPLPKMRKKLPLQPTSSSIASPPVSGIIKRSNITGTPPHWRSRRSLFTSSRFIQDQATEERSDGRSNSSADGDCEEEEEGDADDSCVTYGSHSDGSQFIYQAGQSSQAEALGFGVPLDQVRNRESDRIPLADVLESKILAAKNNRKLARAAAAAVALAAPLSPQHLAIALSAAVALAVPLSPQHFVSTGSAAIDLPVPVAFQHLAIGEDAAVAPALPVSPQHLVRTGGAAVALPVPVSPQHLARAAAAEVALAVPAPFSIFQIPLQNSVPLAPAPKLNPPSRMKLSRAPPQRKDISTQTSSALCDSASTQTSPWDAPVTLSDLREEIRTLLVGLGF